MISFVSVNIERDIKKKRTSKKKKFKDPVRLKEYSIYGVLFYGQENEISIK